MTDSQRHDNVESKIVKPSGVDPVQCDPMLSEVGEFLRKRCAEKSVAEHEQRFFATRIWFLH